MISKVIIHYKHNSVVSLIAWLLRNVFRSQNTINLFFLIFLQSIELTTDLPSCREYSSVGDCRNSPARSCGVRDWLSETLQCGLLQPIFQINITNGQSNIIIMNESGRHARTIKRAVLDQPEIKIEDRVMIMIDSDSKDRVYRCLWEDVHMTL